MSGRNLITVFEHQSIRFLKNDDSVLSEEQLKTLQSHYGSKGVSYYSLIHNGVRFNEYVGVIQVGNLTIEVLPKADNNPGGEDKWRNVLIGMLRAVGNFDVKSTSDANLKIQQNTILDLYFELFIREVEYLLHNGLIKKYRKKQSNLNALKGNIQFGKHIQLNVTHQEKFYVRHTTYDVEHTLHFILYKTICLLKRINTNANLQSRIGALLLHFPEMPDIKVTEATFKKLLFNRKNQSYKKAIDIAKLLLLRYHPDISSGRSSVLALMFDMNKLWEQFVYVSLRKQKDIGTITAQYSKDFWKPESGTVSHLRPDIVINRDTDQCIVIDTKWKMLYGKNPSADDLRQMYVYGEFYRAYKAALVYPGNNNRINSGNYFTLDINALSDKRCSFIEIKEPGSSINNSSIVKEWQHYIQGTVKKYIYFNNI